MATNTSIQRLARNVRTVDVGSFQIDDKVVMPAANNGDRVVLFAAPCGLRMFSAHLRQNGALGAGATLQLQKNSGGVYTNITAATTAGAANVASSTGLIPIDLAPGDTIEVLTGGANNVAAPIEYDILARRA